MQKPKAKRLPLFARFIRFFPKARFRLLGLATIKDIPTDQFNEIIRALIDDGWKLTSHYSGFDAWIDYGRVKLRKKPHRLKFEWDNWTEGSIEGKPDVLGEIARRHNLKMIDEWRWSEYDDNV